MEEEAGVTATVRLASAVSSAGGLGTVGYVNAANTAGSEYIREQINYIRSQTDKPFGAGLSLSTSLQHPRTLRLCSKKKSQLSGFPWLTLGRG